MAEPMRGYHTLFDRADASSQSVQLFAPNQAYDEYLRMHKVYVGLHGAAQLERIYESLAGETMPDYLAAAGWAATEAAVVRTDRPAQQRQHLIDGAVDCWQRATKAQQALNLAGPDCVREDALPHRTALDIACAPLFRGVIAGRLAKGECRRVFEDCLNIAQSNVVSLNLAARAGSTDGVAAHVGLGYECNALLAFNKKLSSHYFAVPSTMRSDSGYYYPNQTHDIQIIQHGGGAIRNVTPVEIKAAASVRDRNRFWALLVRGKMHLSVEGKFTPEHTLEAITAAYQGSATQEQRDIDSYVSTNMRDMVRRYHAGAVVTRMADVRSTTKFHDRSLVSSHYPGIAQTS